MPRIQAAVKVTGFHLIISILVAISAAILVWGVWFPYPYRELAGGEHLFWVLVGVDIVCGPLLTLVLYSPVKSKRELGLDLSLVALIQLAALVYGLHSINLARPMVLAFEVDRFVVVTAAQIDKKELSDAPDSLRTLPWFWGIRLLGTRAPHNGQEMLESINLSLQGIEPSARPSWWLPYDDVVQQVKQRMKPLAALWLQRSEAQQREVINDAAQTIGQPLAQLYYLPLTSRKIVDNWIVLLNDKAQIVGYAPIDGFE